MTDSFDAEAQPERTKGLEVHVIDSEFVIFEAETDRVHYLNATAALILEFCNGRHSVPEIANLVQEAYALDAAPLSAVREALAGLKEQGLVQ